MLSINLNSNDIINLGLCLSGLTITSGILSELRYNTTLNFSGRFSNNLRASSYVIMTCSMGKIYHILLK